MTVSPGTYGKTSKEDGGTTAPSAESKDGRREWRAIVAKYETPSLPRSLRQIANSIVPYLAILGPDVSRSRRFLLDNAGARFAQPPDF